MRHLFFLLMAFAASHAQYGQPAVEVFLPPVHGPEPVLAFAQARDVVRAIYSEIGVRIAWTTTRSLPSGCTKQPLHVQIVTALGSAEGFSSAEAMAFANPFAKTGPCVTLFMDRLTAEIHTNPLHTGNLLGHVLAHEMGHVLQGIARHAETGLMKSKWSLHDTAQMWSLGHLHLTEDDADLILRSLRQPLVN